MLSLVLSFLVYLRLFYQQTLQFLLSICIFSTSIEPIWFDSEKIETKRNGIKTLPRLNFLPSLGKFFCSLFSTFSVFSDFFPCFPAFFQKKMKRNEIPTDAWILPSLGTILIPTLINFPSLGTKFCRCLKFISNIYCQLYRKDENKIKVGREWPIFFKKTVHYNRIWTRIVGVEGKNDDHLTTTAAPKGYFLQ